MMDCFFPGAESVARIRLDDKIVKTINASTDRGAIAESKLIAGTCTPTYYRVRRVSRDEDIVIYDSRQELSPDLETPA